MVPKTVIAKVVLAKAVAAKTVVAKCKAVVTKAVLAQAVTPKAVAVVTKTVLAQAATPDAVAAKAVATTAATIPNSTDPRVHGERPRQVVVAFISGPCDACFARVEPPVPILAKKKSILPPVWRQISGPVVW